MAIDVLDISLQGAGAETTKWLSVVANDVYLALDSSGVSEEEVHDYFVLVIAPPEGEVIVQVVHRTKAREALTRTAKRLRSLGVKSQMLTESIIAKCAAGSTADAIRIGYFDVTGCGSAQILRGDILQGMEQGNESADALRKFRTVWEDALARVKRVVIPPNAGTATNLEAVLMAAAYTFDELAKIGLSADTLARLIGLYARGNKTMLLLLERMNEALRGKQYSGLLQDFGAEWMLSGFPKLEVGHKLAATLALTDVPDELEVLAPWKSWSLIVPPGLFGDNPIGKHLARFWCVGAEVRFIINSSGEVLGPLTRSQLLTDGKYADVCSSIDSLVRGACLALSNPDDYKRQKLSEKVAGTAKKAQRDGVPDFAVSRFMLSAPVQIDLREHLRAVVSGKRTGGGAPTVQFFVRGHWRNQAHGLRMSLRKQMRIDGYWKGPEHGAVKLGNYKVKDDGIDSGAKGKDAEQHSDSGAVQGDTSPVPSR